MVKTDDVIYRNDVTVKLFDCLMYGGQPVFEDDLDTLGNFENALWIMIWLLRW